MYINSLQRTKESALSIDQFAQATYIQTKRSLSRPPFLYKEGPTLDSYIYTILLFYIYLYIYGR